MEVRKMAIGKQFLTEIRDLNKTIEILGRQIQAEESRLMDISVHYKDIQVQTSGSGDMMWEKVPEIVDLTDQLKTYVRELEEKKSFAVSAIRQLPPRRQSVLMLYYIQGKTMEKAAEEMEKSYRWFWNELQAAVVDFSKTFEEKKGS